MACQTCGNNIPYAFNTVQPCLTTAGSCSASDASCVQYTGPALSCIAVQPNTNLQDVLAAINTAVCSNITYDWSSFNYNCLVGAPFAAPDAFVDAMTAQYCSLLSAYTGFTTSTYPGDITDIQGRLGALEVPGLTNACTTVGSGDTMNQVLTKIMNTLCDTVSNQDLSGANWNQCLTVVSAPTTLLGAVNTLIDQICQVYGIAVAGSSNLPTFNNVGSCLASPGTSDSLVDTITKIRTLLCTLPTFDHTSLTFGCVPSSTTLQDTIQQLLNYATGWVQTAIFQVDPTYFSLTPIGGSCDGYQLSFTGTLGQDRLVAADPTDTVPGTLIDKLESSDSSIVITLDTASSPDNKISLTVLDSLKETYQVKADASDTAPDFLDNKMIGVPDTDSILNVHVVYNGGTQQVELTPTFDFTNLGNALFTYILANPSSTAATQFAAAICAAPSCTAAPQYTLIEVENTTGSAQSFNIGYVFNTNAFAIPILTVTTGFTQAAGTTVTYGYTPLTTVSNYLDLDFNNANVSTSFNYTISMVNGTNSNLITIGTGSLSAMSGFSSYSQFFPTSTDGIYKLKIVLS